MRQMVAAMNATGGSRETARAIYVQMLNESEDEQSRAKRGRYAYSSLIRSTRSKQVNKALSDLQKRTGRCPDRISDTFSAIKNARLPAGNEFQIDASNNVVDPTGIPYVFDTSTCSIGLATSSKIPRTTK